MARAGLTAKGIVYILLGALAFMAAFELGSASDSADQEGALSFVQKGPGGAFLLGLISLGLLCYAAWRAVQTFSPPPEDQKWSKRLRYFISGLTYLSLSLTALRLLMHRSSQGGGGKQQLAARLLQESYGQWLTGIAALVLAGVGIYQLYYGLSKKYKKHVEQSGIRSQAARLLVSAGTIGYVARGLVWLILAYLLFQAALHANASEAGDTAEAFQLVERSFGSYLLGALGLGLILYGLFSCLRAAYERFH
jgi:Mn2+/Fe2+ NRAMP family transporter